MIIADSNEAMMQPGASKADLLQQTKLVVDMVHESRLVTTILTSARGGHATDLMVEQAIALVDNHIATAETLNDARLLKNALDLKAGLEDALRAGVKSLRGVRPPGEETIKVEQPLAAARIAQGHTIRRQHRCSSGIVDIFDLTTDELIECKARGSSAALGEAAGQLKRYARSFPGSSLIIAVPSIDPDAEWLAKLLRGEGIEIIEVAFS